MLKQDVKTINYLNSCIIPTFFSPVQALCNLVSSAFFLSLPLMPKIKKTLETSLDLTPSFKTCVDAKVEGSCFECGLFINYDAVILFKRNVAEKDVCLTHSFSSIDSNFSFCTDFLHR